MAATKKRMGMIGGGEGAFIGAIHRMAALLDGEIELVCGAFNSDPARSQQFGLALGLPAERCYGDWRDMLASEAALPPERRMEFVSIVTPTHLHFPIATAALAAGFHVLSDKPATRDLAEALALREQVQNSGRRYALTHIYTGYPLMAQARQTIREGRLGRIRKVLVEYTQGWLATDAGDNKQARWRLDPAQAGASCCIADIGTHAFNLLEHVTGLPVLELSAELSTFVPGRTLDDDGSMLLRLADGARGVLTASQICVGDENALSLRVYGERGALEWRQQEPNTLLLKWPDRPTEMVRAAGGYLGAAARAGSRTPAGHPGGYHEAYANIYRAYARSVRETGEIGDGLQGIEAGVRAMAFVETAVRSSALQGRWCAIADAGDSGGGS
jgi:predicted dehydrogenase